MRPRQTKAVSINSCLYRLSELFSVIRFILLIGESINYMTFTQKHVDLPQSLAIFAQIRSFLKTSLVFSLSTLMLSHIIEGKILGLTRPRFVKVVKNRAYSDGTKLSSREGRWTPYQS